MMATNKARAMLLGLCCALGCSQVTQAQGSNLQVTPMAWYRDYTSVAQERLACFNQRKDEACVTTLRAYRAAIVEPDADDKAKQFILAEVMDVLCWRVKLKREEGNLAGAYTLVEDTLHELDGAAKPSLRLSFAPMAEFVYTALQIPSHEQAGEDMLHTLRVSLEEKHTPCADYQDICMEAEEMEGKVGDIYAQLARNGGVRATDYRNAAVDAYGRVERWIPRVDLAGTPGRFVLPATLRLAEVQITRALELVLAGDFAAARTEINAATAVACAASQPVNNPTANNARCERARKALAAVDNGAAVKALAAPPAEGPKDEE